MQFYSEKHEQAKNLYFNAGKSSGEIASALGIDRKTVYNWIKQSKWEEMKIVTDKIIPQITKEMLDFYKRFDQSLK